MNHVLIDRRDGVGYLTLNRPEVHNACNHDMLCEISQAIDILEQEAGVGAVVIGGTAPSFCSGSDVKELRSLSDIEAQARARLDYGVKERVASCTKPVLAAIRGYCLGGGLELASACDLRIAAEDAVFGLPEIKLGSLPGSGGLQRLPGLIGAGRTKDWAMTGRMIAAQEALQAGLLMEICSGPELNSRIHQVAATMAGRSALAMRVIKAALDHGPSGQLARSMTLHELASGAVRRNKDFG
jgi:enoyl-CoA hydratase/carnithine racemase